MKEVGEHSRHVLDEDPLRLALPNNAGCIGPKVALIIGPEPLAGDGVGLAGDAAHKAIHRSMPRSASEGSQIRPNRRRIKPSLFHPRNQLEDCRRFVFHVADRSSRWLRDSEADIESAASSADAEHSEGR